MKREYSLRPFCFIILLFLAACGGGTLLPEPAAGIATETAAVASDALAAVPTDDETMADESMADQSETGETLPEAALTESDAEVVEVDNSPEAASITFEGPDWLTLALRDSRTGDPFTLADFGGKTVYVEPMATWCTNCRRQLNTLSAEQDQLPDDVVLVGLSVEPNLQDEILAGYANNQGYNFLFAVATPELIEAMVAEYGRNVANPPATPHFIIRPDGTVTELATGFHTIQEIVAQIEAETQ